MQRVSENYSCGMQTKKIRQTRQKSVRQGGRLRRTLYSPLHPQLQVEETLKQHVDLLRRRGVTWAQIGEALSVSRQAAWERFSGEE
jgi:hypothetical protein